MGGDRIGTRIALVTGAARGIGRAVSLALKQAGARVVVADIDAALGTETARELGSSFVSLDVRRREAWSEAIESIERDHGSVDILVNNAGIMPLGGFLDLPTAVDERQIAINVMGVLHGMRAVLPGMVSRRNGHIVNVASATGKVGMPYSAVYSATKHAVVGLTEAVRREYEGSSIGFTYVMPCLVDTELIRGSRPPVFPPVIRPEDVANAVVTAIQKGHVDVYVPSVGRLAPTLSALLPRRVYERIGKWFRFDRMFADVNATERASYHRRAFGDP